MEGGGHHWPPCWAPYWAPDWPPCWAPILAQGEERMHVLNQQAHECVGKHKRGLLGPVGLQAAAVATYRDLCGHTWYACTSMKITQVRRTLRMGLSWTSCLKSKWPR